MSFTDRLNEVTPCDPTDYIRFDVDTVTVGMMSAAFAHTLATFPDTFQVDPDHVTLSPNYRDHGERSRAVAFVLAQLRDQGMFPGWRDELYPVSKDFHAPSLFDIERAAARQFGIRTHAICLNGFARRNDGLHLWIARRAMTKQTFPGEMDLMVGGGHPVGIGLRENLIKECHEEAGIGQVLAEKAISVGGISFCCKQPDGIINEFQFIYDLEVPADFTPQNADGEVDAFYLWSAEQVMETVYNTNAFVFDSALVLIDFLIRHGVIYPNHPEYSALVLGLRR